MLMNNIASYHIKSVLKRKSIRKQSAIALGNMQQASYHLATSQHYLILIATCLEFHMHTQIATLHSLACLCGYTYLMPIVVACS